jgi:DNA polymerase/3'-5' exonuclease PolX
MSIMQVTQTIQIMPPASLSSGRRHLQPMLPGMEIAERAAARVSNRQIAEVLSGIADLLEGQRSNPYRIQAYRNAARGVLDLLEPAAEILARGEALPIAGLGRLLGGRIAELVESGSMTFQNGLVMQTLPQGVRALMAVEHVGPYTAIRLYEELGVDSAEKLWWAAQRQQIRKLPGFGARSEARLKEAASHLIRGKRQEQPLDGVA